MKCLKKVNTDAVVHMDTETKSIIGFFAHAMNTTEKAVMKEVFGNLFCIGANFPKNLNLEFEATVSESKLTISFLGSSNMIFGQFRISEDADRAEADMRLKYVLESKIKAKKGVKA